MATATGTLTAAKKLTGANTAANTGAATAALAGTGLSGGSTYRDFQNKLASSGLSNQFSQYDLDLASKYPEFGLSAINLKSAWNNTSDQALKSSYNEQLNRLRSSYGNYTGGTNGADYISDGKAASQASGLLDSLAGYNQFSYESPYTSMLNDALKKLQGAGSFQWDGVAPTYTNQYADTQKQLLDAILNREEFSYDKDTDPQWSAYKKEYLREGDRATANALAQASVASGGRPSSYAQTAATQAGDYYAGQLADILPTLYQQAYERYLNEYSMKQQDLSAVNNQEQLDYSKYLNDLGQYNTDRSFALDAYNTNQNQAQNYASLLANLDNQAYNQAYNTWSGNYDLLSSQYGTVQNKADSEYNAYLDALDRAAQKEQLQYNRAQTQQALYQNMADAILQTGNMPSAELLTGSGYTQEYADALEAYYRSQILQAAAKSAGSSSGSSKSSGSSGSSSGSKSKMSFTTAKQAAAAGVFSDDVLDVLRENGFSDEMLRAVYGYSGASGNRTITPTYQNVYNQITHMNPGTMENAPEYFYSEILSGLNGGTITEDEADKLMDLIGVN